VQSIRTSMYVCLFVCLCLLAYLKKTVQISPDLLYVLRMAISWSSSDGNAMLCTSGFVDDVMLSYNAGNRIESKMTRMFHPVH